MFFLRSFSSILARLLLQFCFGFCCKYNLLITDQCFYVGIIEGSYIVVVEPKISFPICEVNVVWKNGLNIY